MNNIEQFSAKIGFDLVRECIKDGKGTADEVRNVINKAMGILQQNGIYAFFLWLEYKAGKGEKAEEIYALKIHFYALIALGEELKNDWEEQVERVETLIANKDYSIEKLYFMKSLLQKMLTYSLYKAKSKVSLGDKNGD